MGLGETLGFQLAHMSPSLNSPPDESGLLQCFDVLGGRGEGHAKGIGQLSDAALGKGQAVEHRPPRRIGKGMKHSVEMLGSMFNHVVEYIGAPADCQPNG